jgi:predicted enzyme related to lactoylglutathione lyase
MRSLQKAWQMQPPLGRLAYLYIGTAAFDRDVAYYRDVLGAEVVWAFNAFDAKVAALRVADGPLFLLADHRPAPSCMPILAVENLEATVEELKERGWHFEGNLFEIPNGPCCRFNDPSGNPLALFQDVRPDAMERAFADKDNPRAIRM